MRAYWSPVDTVAQMDVPIFLIWGAWDTLLTGVVVFLYWLYAQQFGDSPKSVFMAATVGWLFFFVLFWVGAWNMGLTGNNVLPAALSLSWVEMVIACFIAKVLFAQRWIQASPAVTSQV